MGILQKREERGRREGRQEGRREGILEEKQEIAKNLMKEGTEIALIVKVTGLSKSQVEKLKLELDNK